MAPSSANALATAKSPAHAERYSCCEPSLLEALLKNQCSLAEQFEDTAEVLKHTQKVSCKILSVGSHKLFVKRYQPPKIPGLTNRAERVFSNARHLESLGIPTARALALITPAFSLTRKPAFVALEALTGMEDLRDLNAVTVTERPAHYQQLFDRIAIALGQLHRSGYSHGDFKWANVMTDASSTEFRIVDLDGMRPHRLKATYYRAADLARFLLNAAEQQLPMELRQSFVQHYCQTAKPEASDFREKVQMHYQKLRQRHHQQYGVHADDLFHW